MEFHVYIIHNILNNKIYVGKTKDLKKRWINHISSAKYKITNQYIHKAIRKYGSNNFIFSEVQSFKNGEEYIIYGISQQQVSRIINGKKWSHLFLETK